MSFMCAFHGWRDDDQCCPACPDGYEGPIKEEKKARRRIWVEFSYDTDNPRAVANTHQELNDSWFKERQEMGIRYQREYEEVSS